MHYPILAVVEFVEQERLRHHVVAQAGNTHGFVGAVRVGLGVFGARHEHLRMGEDALQLGDERDGAAFALVHRIDTKGLTQRLLGVAGGLALRVHGPAHALIERRDMNFGTEGRM